MLKKDKSNDWILFVHGSQHDIWCWGYFEDFCNNSGYGTYCISLQGNGKKTVLDDYVEELHKVISEREIAPIVITHSLGSSILQKYLKKYEDTVKKLVFLSPTPPKHIWRTLFHVKYNMLRQKKSSLFFSDHPDEITIEKYIKKLKYESFKVQLQVLKKVWNKDHVPKIPCLVIGAWDDRCMPVSSICEMGRYLNCKTIILPGLSHDMMLAPEWEKAANEILAFLQ